MKIGAMVPQGWRMDLHDIKPEQQWDTIIEASARIEKLNYASVWVYDHFHTVPSPTQDPTFECWSLMAALSQVTENVRIGQMCTCNSYSCLLYTSPSPRDAESSRMPSSA